MTLACPVLGSIVCSVTSLLLSRRCIADHDKVLIVLPGGSVTGPVVGLLKVTHTTWWSVWALSKTFHDSCLMCDLCLHHTSCNAMNLTDALLTTMSCQRQIAKCDLCLVTFQLPSAEVCFAGMQMIDTSMFAPIGMIA